MEDERNGVETGHRDSGGGGWKRVKRWVRDHGEN